MSLLVASWGAGRLGRHRQPRGGKADGMPGCLQGRRVGEYDTMKTCHPALRIPPYSTRQRSAVHRTTSDSRSAVHVRQGPPLPTTNTSSRCAGSSMHAYLRHSASTVHGSRLRQGYASGPRSRVLLCALRRLGRARAHRTVPFGVPAPPHVPGTGERIRHASRMSVVPVQLCATAEPASISSAYRIHMHNKGIPQRC